MLFLFLLQAVLAIQFDLKPQAKNNYRWGKCVTVPIGPTKLVTGYFKLGSAEEQLAGVQIYDTQRNIHYSRKDLPSGEVRFSFRTHENTLNYNFCVKSVWTGKESPITAEPREVQLLIEVTNDLFDTDKAHEMKVMPVIKEMTYLGAIIYDVNEEFDKLLKDGEKITKNNKSTFNRVFLVNLICVIVMIFAGVWQLYHLRKFFKTKKLI